ncbi:hypothetical protein [Sunxiuqinia elliptica]|uniref:Uncharacterized protein n=1 Tax=Sunxiuqinia elliptica TaxID=655355 RepID=A0A4R6HCW6_9BACT|nr:hypothetical protein [Sunxiuqinia elliptica]TDO05565.1 hypothetical protein DET52_101927 [Sunxiuqinia elliptica]TDO65109.1 hypothetical protein DET65_1485 [Sunxiuqinia elliptica]
MRQRLFYFLMFVAILFVACEDFEDPQIPQINDFDLTLKNTDGVSVSSVWVKAYYLDMKPGFVVDSTFTSVLGNGSFSSLEPRNYTLKAFRDNGEELGSTEVTVSADQALNAYDWALDVFIENYDFTVELKDNRQNPIVERKVGLYTAGDNPVLIQEGFSGSDGRVVFGQTVVGTYQVNVYDEENIAVFAQKVSAVGASEANSELFVVQRLFHDTKVVITGFFSDPRGSDSPKIGQLSGDGFSHPGQYEYVQLMAVQDINFAEEPYAVVFTNTGSPTEFGWADGLYSAESKRVYQINLEKGSVQKGQYFYVGGSSRMICSYYKLSGSPQLGEDKFWGVDYWTLPGGNGNGIAKSGSGLLGNGSGKSQSSVVKKAPDGIAVFEGTQVDTESIPVDAIFYGTEATYEAYQVPDNDIYSRTNQETGESQPLFGNGTNDFLFPVPAQDQGMFIKLGGQVTPTEWLVPRSGTPLLFNMKDYPGASVADIENAADCTLFIDK